ncbi:MAG: alpha-1,4-glucan--maltose-1-phosphate maltosyltransferase [Dehalococcoidales bacterium]|jgi:starch synthase (maltosyl-transferring)
MMKQLNGPMDSRCRIIIEGVSPEVDGGRYPAKAAAGDTVNVEADIYADGHDVLSARLLYRRGEETGWRETPMRLLVNDRWAGSFAAAEIGDYIFTITAWVDCFKTWRRDLKKRLLAADKDLMVHFRSGIEMITEVRRCASKNNKHGLKTLLDTLNSPTVSDEEKIDLAMSDEITELMEKCTDRRNPATYAKELTVRVEREKAGFSAWYEMFPRSVSPAPGKHGTFRDCEARLPYIAEMGFDVLYLPPIHPVGVTSRKGKNNAVAANNGDPGTPWAIGAAEGGHKAVNPELGTLEDFRRFLAKAGEFNMEIALDIAFQCSPDHPYVREHPEWFLRRPDGTIQYAENPPKKYQDIYPLNFDTENWRELWEELKSIVVFWAEQGVRIFRVDNPHTKPFRFWEWLIGEVKQDYPDAIFLAEAFTRPKVMYRLAKLGFTQSYTYFTWRNHKKDLTEYLVELTQTPVKDFFRPNFWPNTPDILHAYLQKAGQWSFQARLVLAATLSSNYGIYGPAFELMENTPRAPGSEEYLNSEKYEIKHWDTDRPDSLKGFIGSVNRIRKENPALRRNRNLWFNASANDHIICYSKHTDDRANIIFIAVNLDPQAIQSSMVNVPLAAWGFDTEKPYQVIDLLSGKSYTWRGEWNYVELNPAVCPAHIFRLTDLTPAPVKEAVPEVEDEKGQY